MNPFMDEVHGRSRLLPAHPAQRARSEQKRRIQGDRFSDEQFSAMLRLLRLYRDRYRCGQSADHLELLRPMLSEALG